MMDFHTLSIKPNSSTCRQPLDEDIYFNIMNSKASNLSLIIISTGVGVFAQKKLPLVIPSFEICSYTLDSELTLTDIEF